MPAYLIGNVEIHDEPAIAEYRRMALPLVEKFGGKAIAIDATPVLFEGNWAPRNMIMLEFPDLAAVRNLLASPEYAPLAALRQASAHTDLVAFGTD
ncbi:DUF1330 domain-containing protein [Xanthomonas sp. AM6]|uniref:DUF1330 domain-containing protein n=1 Tax=Xanthomonas sp. AM6 TaxID=2982531 RepID=UPI0021D8EE49|nr:DUF1330 domain-containing protein [Xanthomonas sp. AM6]UYB54276.1 DUF1330 domain-containing protein [Xanthomonas sp. AM6]